MHIVITGVTRGLGRALTVAFDAAGHTVHGCGRSAADLHALAGRVAARHTFRAVDVADDDAVAAWAKAVFAAGRPELVINNAALMNRPAPLWEVPRAEHDAIIDVNIKGVVNVIRHFVPGMLAHGGMIANLSSGWGRSVSPEVAPYCTTKWAIEGLSRALAAELPRGMGCVAVNPGIIDTDMLRTCWGDDAGSYPEAAAWAGVAAPFFLSLTPRQSGRALTVG